MGFVEEYLGYSVYNSYKLHKCYMGICSLFSVKGPLWIFNIYFLFFVDEWKTTQKSDGPIYKGKVLTFGDSCRDADRIAQKLVCSGEVNTPRCTECFVKI